MAWLYKQPGSDNWFIGYRLNGKQHRKTTGTADKVEAERELARLRSMDQAHKAGSLTEEFFRLLTNKVSSTDTLRGVVKQWLEDCKGHSWRTLEKYKATLEEFCQHLNADEFLPIREVRAETIRTYLRQKRAATSMATANLNRKVLTAFFNYAVSIEVLSLNPVPSGKALKLTKDKKSERRSFTLAELKTLYKKAPSDFWRYMVMGGYFTALRMGDLIVMPWGAVDFEENKIRLTTRKTNTAMNIPLRPEFANLLLKLKRQRGTVKPADPIWPEEAARYEAKGAGTFSNEFYDEVLLPAGLVPPRSKYGVKDENGNRVVLQGRKVNPVSFHCLRHTFVSLVKVTGGSQAVAKELAGHSSDAVSDLYTHVPEEAMSEAIKRLPGVTK